MTGPITPKTGIDATSQTAASRRAQTTQKSAASSSTAGKPLLQVEANRQPSYSATSLTDWPAGAIRNKPSVHDITTLLNKFTAGPQIEKLAVIMQQFMMETRKTSRSLMYAENTLYMARMEQAKQSVEQQAVWALAGAAMAGVAIAGAALNFAGAFKSAAIDKAGVKGIETKITKFTKTNLGIADDAPLAGTANLGRASRASSLAGSIRRRSSRDAEAAEAAPTRTETMESFRLSGKAGKTSRSDRVNEFAELEEALTPIQQQNISQLRGALTNQSQRVMARYQGTAGILEATGKMLGDTMHAMGAYERATQVEAETGAGAAQFARGASEQLYGSLSDGINKMQQKVSSILDSEADTRKHSIRA